jgi:predicted NBD/HSP70 family sugar kinase
MWTMRGEAVRQLQRTRVLDVLREHGPASRADLMRVTGLSRPTVSSIVTELLDISAIRMIGKNPAGTKGRPSGLLAVAPPAGRAVSVDIGHTHARVIVADATGLVVEERVKDYEEPATAERVLSDAARLVAKVMSGIDSTAGIAGATVGLPSPVDLTGKPIARRFRDVDPLAILGLHAYTDRVRVLNDADLGAAGEAAFGAGTRFDTFLHVKISHGIGAGLILGGRLYRGRGYAGDIGHIRVVDDGEVCLCGNRGCLETVASSKALLKALQPAHHDVSLGFADLVRLAETGDRGTHALLFDAGRIIGRALSALVTTLNPDAIVVGGALGALGGPVLRGIDDTIDRYSQPLALQDLVVTEAGCGNRAEALGGIALAFGLVKEFGRPYMSTLMT